jgi:catechol 2,3-dioxygenase-like lactoylglutathione lyase family enzyme
LQVPDVDQSRDFYTDLLGMKVIYYKPGDVFGVDYGGGPVCFLRFGENTLYLRKSLHPEHKPYIAHFAPVVENYNQAAVKAELERRGYKPEPDSKYGWSIKDPAGMRVEVAGKGLPEHVGSDCNGANSGCPGGPDK